MPVKQEARIETRQGANFTAIHTGPLGELDSYTLEVPALNRTVKGKLFIKEFLGLTGMQISMNKLPARGAVPFYHKHRENEECYIFVSGHGQMQIDGDTFAVGEGSIVRISTGGNRTLRNTGDSDLQFICIQARENSLNQDTFEDGIRDEAAVTWPESK
ncbi:MAG: cupin domain-containing protein [Candidatus Melainabacteria bacterium]|nr:cupin domain-containing protein [Candidatus Melainabacteria bacterium]